MNSNKSSLLLLAASLAIITLAAGCMFQSLPPVEIYTIEPVWSQGEPTQTARQEPLILQLAFVRGAESFTTTEILYTDRLNSQNSYAYSRWRDPPVRSMQTLLEAALGQSGLFRAVLPPTSVSRVDLLLESTLLDFSHHIREDKAAEGVVRMRFHLVNNTSKRVMAGTELVARKEAVSSDARGATAAINQAAVKVADDLVAWLSELGKFQEQL